MNKKDEIGSGIVLMILAAVFYAFSFRIQYTTSDILGSRFFPQAAAILIILLAAIQIIQALKGNENTPKADAVDNSEETEVKAGVNPALILTIVSLFAYYFVIQQVGFVITSIIYLLFESWVLMNKLERSNKKLVAIVLVADVLFPIFLNFIFYNIFHIQLPVGKLFR